MRETILVVDDDKSLREFLEIFLAQEGYNPLVAGDGPEALALLESHPVSLVLSDIRMPEMDGVTLLRRIRQRDPQMPVILITAFASLETAVDAMKEGALDYITKPFQLDELRQVIEQGLAARRSASREETGPAQPQERGRVHHFHGMVAASPAMINIFSLIPRVAESSASVLITGESGTGKELVARAIHRLSARRERSFVAVNCGGIPDTLLESELFGHVRGAFTGAAHDKKGLFALAHGGTIFLDEIGDLPMQLQVKRLRVVQERRIMPLGSGREVAVDVRIIAATNRDLEREVIEGRFREDLYYRLNVIHLEIPPLRERPEDIPILVQYFLDRYSKEHNKEVQGISKFAMEALLSYPFPGNVRELENIIERSVALSTSNLILPDSLSLARHKAPEAVASQPSPMKEMDLNCLEVPDQGLDIDGFLAAVEKRLIERALEKAGGSKARAAELLGINLRSLRYRMGKHGL